MAQSPTVFHNGQKQFVQVSLGSVWHKWAPFGPGQNETLAGPGGGTAAGCSGFKVTVVGTPCVTENADGSMDVTFEGSDGSAWLVTQAQFQAVWTGGQTA